jgi:hypothetical protein
MGNKNKRLCVCGHSSDSHSNSTGECYTGTARKERRKNQFDKYVYIKCFYQCVCRKFEFLDKEKI